MTEITVMEAKIRDDFCYNCQKIGQVLTTVLLRTIFTMMIRFHGQIFPCVTTDIHYNV